MACTVSRSVSIKASSFTITETAHPNSFVALEIITNQVHFFTALGVMLPDLSRSYVTNERTSWSELQEGFLAVA